MVACIHSLPHVLIERKKSGSQAAAQISEKISLEHDPEKWTPEKIMLQTKPAEAIDISSLISL
jgi:hypothetical protein